MTTLVDRLDDWGKPAWITAMVLGFVLFWPIGLLILFYMMRSGRMGCGHAYRSWNQDSQQRWEHKMDRMRQKMARWQEFRDKAFSNGAFNRAAPFPASGNSAFDEYRADTLRKLEEESREFSEFLTRLRRAKDKTEFDDFMNDRRNRPQPPTVMPEGDTPAPSA